MPWPNTAVDTGRTYGFPGFWVGGDAVLQTRPDRRRGTASAGAAYHLFALRQCERGSGGAGDVLRSFH